MKLIQTQLYRILIPKFIRKKVLAFVLRKEILAFYSNASVPLSAELKSTLDYIDAKGIAMLPGAFRDEYIEDQIVVFFDPEIGLRYVLQEGKRLYFKRRWSDRRIRQNFNELLREQDYRSPHRYEATDFVLEDGDVLVDIGAAEGNYALSVVEKAARIILFESSKEWMEPLQATFSPWKDKVIIVQKFVSDKVDKHCTTLDHFFKPGEKVSFLKIDVEGAESLVFSGAKRILQSQDPLKVAVCTYHKPGDELEFKTLLKGYDFTVSHADGFILTYTDKKIKAPFLRRGVVRAVKPAV